MLQDFLDDLTQEAFSHFRYAVCSKMKDTKNIHMLFIYMSFV